MTMPDDEALLARIAQGDQQAMQSLYERYRLRLWRYLWSLLGGEAEWTEEVLQDTFLAVWRSAERYRGEARVATWLYHTARHLAGNARRDRRRRGGDAVACLDGEAMGDVHQPSHEEAVVNRLALSDALQQIAPKHREVIELVFYHGFQLHEIAEILEVPVGTVKSRLSYARRALQDKLVAQNKGE